jgi:hypothetical protein
MKRFGLLLLLGMGINVSLALWMTDAGTARTLKTSSIVGNLQTAPSGSGCSFKRQAKDGAIFWWESNDQPAIMNINGKDRSIDFFSRTFYRGEGVGSKSALLFKSGKITVLIDRVQSTVCTVGDVECEGVSYNATISVRVGDRQEKVLAEGYCGS